MGEIMKNLKIKNPNLCMCFLILVALIIIAIPILLAIILPRTEVTLPIVLALLLVVITFFVSRNLLTIIELTSTVDEINAHKKLRQFYFTDINGRTVDSAQQAINARFEKFGKALDVKTENGLISARRKRKSYNSDFASGLEEYAVLFKTDSLSKNFCSKVQNECKKIINDNAQKGKWSFLKTRSEKNLPVLRACGAIIICNVADSEAIKYINREYSKNDISISLCICEMSTGRYYFNAKEIYVDSLIPLGKNNAEHIIKKLVFKGNLNLESNDYFVPDSQLPYDLEMPLFEFLKKIYKENNANFGSINKSMRSIKKLVKELQDGEIKILDDIIYYKKNGKTLSFGMYSKKELGISDDDRKFVVTEDQWIYPKASKISKNDKEEALSKIGAYLNMQGIDFYYITEKEFDDILEEEE